MKTELGMAFPKGVRKYEKEAYGYKS